MQIFSSELFYDSESNSNTITITFHENTKNLTNITINGTQYNPANLYGTSMELDKGSTLIAYSRGAIGLAQSNYKLVITLNNKSWSSYYSQIAPYQSAASVTISLQESGTISFTQSK